jgi:hypothetical protein
MTVEVFNSMLGKTMVSVTGSVGSDEMAFKADDGKKFLFYHDQGCCEHVSMEDIAGDLKDLVGSPITMAEEVSSDNEPEVQAESYTWTFYKFATVKGSVTVRWLGTSNGYYSEGVFFSESET